MLHWICEDNTCAVTLAEKQIRKKCCSKYSVEDCVSCKLIEPIYDFNKNHRKYTVMIYSVFVLLWMISVSRLIYKYKNNEVDKWTDLFRF
jgi:hypothetical protein